MSEQNWFTDSRYGLFIHWGPYSDIGRGEQVMFREHMDVLEYEKKACLWNPSACDMREWARTAKCGGFKYACFTTRHHDGYSMWDTAYSDYSSAAQAPKRDFVREFTDAFRAEGIKIGLYYSWLDWRIPAYFEGEGAEGFSEFREYLHNQVRELMTNYGRIDYFFFDGSWPRMAEELGSIELYAEMKRLQPGILINNRLGKTKADIEKESKDGGTGAGESAFLGDFGTPERYISADDGRLWESCQVSTWRLWGYSKGERWQPADVILDMLCECAEKGGNMILNVGPDGNGVIPKEFSDRTEKIGEWLKVHGEAVFGSGSGDLTEFVTYGRQTVRGNRLYLIIRFWDGSGQIRLADLTSDVRSVKLLTTDSELEFEKNGDDLYIYGLPEESPSVLFPVICVECEGVPSTNEWGKQRLWNGDPLRLAQWAAQHGNSVNVYWK